MPDGKRGQRGEQDSSEVGALKGGSGLNGGGYPHEIAEALGRLDFQQGNMGQGNPHIIFAGGDVEARADSGVGVLDGLRRVAVQVSVGGRKSERLAAARWRKPE